MTNTKASLRKTAWVYCFGLLLPLLLSAESARSDSPVASTAKLGATSPTPPVKTIVCPPNTRQYFFLPGQVLTTNGAATTLLVDFPEGMHLEPEGMIDWRFCEGTQFLIPDLVGTTTVNRTEGKFSRYTLSYLPKRSSGIAIKSDRNYRLKTRVKCSLATGEVSLLLRWGDADGGLVVYDGIDTFAGHSDWRDVEHVIKPPLKAKELRIWFNKPDGAPAQGDLLVDSVELYEEGMATQLLGNAHFNDGTAHWFGQVGLANSPDGTALQLRLNGTHQQAVQYGESSPLPHGSKFQTAPFFSVGDLAAGDYSIYYRWLTSPDDVEAAEENLRVTLRDQDAASPPHHLETAVWLAESPFLAYPPLVRETVISLLKDTLINTVYVEGPSLNALPVSTRAADVKLGGEVIARMADEGFKVISYVTYENHFFGPLAPSYLKAHPEAAMVDWVGHTHDDRVCPTYLFLEGENDYRKLLIEVTERLIRETQLSGIFWDLESNIPIPPPSSLNVAKKQSSGGSCFCPRCISLFRKTYGIDDITPLPNPSIVIPQYAYDHLPEPAHSIIKNYPLQWTQFVNSQMAALARELSGAVKRARSTAEFRIYSGLYVQGAWHFPEGGLLRWSEWSGASREQTAPFVDTLLGCHNAGFYEDNEAHIVKELSRFATGREIPMVLDVSCSSQGVTILDLYPRILKTIAFCEGDGAALYAPYSLDSADFSEVRRAFADLAMLEPFFKEGKRVNTLVELESPSKSVKVAAWLLGSRRAVFLLNEGRSPAEIVLHNRSLGPSPKVRQRAYFLHEEENRLENPERVDLVLPGKSLKILMINDVSFEFPPQT